uniref:Uncharacterized protein n=1 Tax=Helianthus annuus TaxID=4232 RepID=A0A251UWJ9_HELAN
MILVYGLLRRFHYPSYREFQDVPKMEKSSIKISRESPTISEKILIMHLWKVAGALHNPNGIRLNAKVP